MSLKLGVLLSGSGSNLEALAGRIEEGALEAEIALVVSDRPGAYGLNRAKSRGFATYLASSKEFPERGDRERAIIEALREHGVEAVVMAGYMRLVSGGFIRAFGGRVLNIHPSLLPGFKGTRAVKEAAEYGVRVSGATVHFADEHMDHGPVVIQAAVAVHPGEEAMELADRIQALEHRIYPQAVQWLSQGRLILDQGLVRLADAPTAAALDTEAGPCLVSPGLEQGF